MAEYISKDDFYDALVERREQVDEAKANDEPLPQVTDYIARCFMLLAENLAKQSKFSGYSYKDEMIADAVLQCVKYVDSFDASPSGKSKNPFSYYTQACFNSFRNRINIEHKQTYITMKMTYNSVVGGDLHDNLSDSEESHVLDNLEFENEYMNGFISDYERKLEDKRIQARKKKAEPKTKNESLSVFS